MRADFPSRRGRAAIACLALAGLAAGAPAARAQAPPPCAGTSTMSDAAGDGHHAPTDVLDAWFTEAAGRLQVVVKVRSGAWVAEHDDAEVPGAGYAVVFTAGGQTRYVRANAPGPARASDPVTFDHGTYTGQFVSAGPTAGTVTGGAGGTATIDVPNAPAGTRITNPYVVTYDGVNGGTPTWVDHAPGGTDPREPSYGAEYVVGACGALTPPGGGTSRAPGAGPVPPGAAVTGVTLTAPASVTGARTVTVAGRVTPARAGTVVTLTRRATGPTQTSRATTGADGTYRVRVRVGETTRLRAAAGGVASRSLTVTVRSRVRIRVRHRRDGSVLVTGTVTPTLPGRVLWLRRNALTPSATTTVRGGTFRLRIKHPRRGRYQAVVVPTGARAERATSNTGVLR